MNQEQKSEIIIDPTIRRMLNATFGAKQKKPHSILYTRGMWELYRRGGITICDFLLQPNLIKNVAFMKNKMTERLNSIWVFNRDWHRTMDDRNGDFLKGQLGRQQMQYHFLKHWIDQFVDGSAKVMGTTRAFPHPLENLSPGLYWEPPPPKKLPNDLGGYKRGEMIVHGALNHRPKDNLGVGKYLVEPKDWTDEEKQKHGIPSRADMTPFAMDQPPHREWDLGRHLLLPVTTFKGSEDRNS